MTILERIVADMKQAMRDKNEVARDTLRMLKSDVGRRELELGRAPDDAEVTEVLLRAVKTRRESLEQYEQGGRAELAQTVEIHTTRDVDGYRRMEQLDSISIAPDQRVRLQPGGTHLMLLGLSRMPAAGETLPLCVGLASGAEVCTVAQVRTAAGRQSEPGHHHQHQK